MKIQIPRQVKLFLMAFLTTGFTFAFMDIGTARATNPPKPYQNLCKGAGVASVEGNFLALAAVIRKGMVPGSDPIGNLLISNLGTSQFPMIKAPAADCLLGSVDVKVDGACNISGANFGTFHFTCPGNTTIDVDTEDIDGEQYPLSSIPPSNETLFNGLKVPIGYGNVAFPTEEDDALTEAVCSFIKDQFDTEAFGQQSDAAAVGSLYDGMAPQLMSCLWSQSFVHYLNVDDNNNPSSCTPEKVSANLSTALLAGAPGLDIEIHSNADGTYRTVDIPTQTEATITVNADGTCTADSSTFELTTF